MTKAELQEMLDYQIECNGHLQDENQRLRELRLLHERFLSLLEAMNPRTKYWGGS
jgi:hypothetical protein